MKLFGLNITREKTLSAVSGSGGWWSIGESFAGAWQKNVEVDQKAVLAFHAVFSCLTLVASDISKLRVKLVKRSESGVWVETDSPAYSPVLRKPNQMQTRMQFFENWILSKLAKGNTYVLKQRDNRGVVNGLHVLDPSRCRPMVTPDGQIYYELKADNLVGIESDTVLVPAREIIHDRFNCLFHPLVGISPIFACGLSATQGLSIQNNSANLFGNASRPGGLLVAPERIDPENAARLKAYWDTSFTGENAGKVAVLGDGLSYQALSVNPTDAQLIEQLKWTAEVVCSTFHVPPYKIGVGEMPKYNNIQSLNVEYYSQALQAHMMAVQSCLFEGLEMAQGLGVHFDLDGLLLMDSAAQMEMLDRAKGKMTVDEMRAKLGLEPKPGGGTIYLQEQDHSLEWLARRDAMPVEPPAAPVEPANDDDDQLQATRALLEITRGLAHV